MLRRARQRDGLRRHRGPLGLPLVLALIPVSLLLWSGCPEDDDDAADDDTGDDDTGDDDTGDDDGGDDDTMERWSGTADIRVVNPGGDPVEDALAMFGGAPSELWGVTGADGRVSIEVTDDGLTDRWLTAGKVGYTSGGAELDDYLGPDGEVTLVITPLPDPADDNLDYHFQPGGDSHSMNASYCGHCHLTISDSWSTSAHHDAASNPRVWDLYVGGADLDAATCASLGGWMAAGQEPGVPGGVLQRCYFGETEGALAFLHDGCGDQAGDPCDHPDQAATLTTYGSCGDCHAPATDGSAGGDIDLARASGVGHEEGVACDLCHKIREVVPGTAPGRDGAVVLQRPSEETFIVGQEFDPIIFGPYPDVPLAIMKGSYAPAMREAGFCSACHEYARGALRPDEVVDPLRWPGGLPIYETWSEYVAAGFDGTPSTCQSCHMLTLDEESSTYNISEVGLLPSIDQGWLRALGEVHYHDQQTNPKVSPYVLMVTLAEADGEVEATVRVITAAGHALPTGDPLRQLVVEIGAVDGGGTPVLSSGGQAIPAAGGWSARGEVGADVVVAGTMVTFSGQTLPDAAAVRFVRAAGLWDDYAGPGTGSFDGLPAAQKGLPIHHVIGERAVVVVAGDQVTLDADAPALLAGDLVYLAGPQETAGAPGWLYAKVLIDADGTSGVAHYRAVDMAFDNRLAPGGSGESVHQFPLPAPGESITVTARLLNRRFAAAVATRYGWDVEDVEVAITSDSFTSP